MKMKKINKEKVLKIRKFIMIVFVIVVILSMVLSSFIFIF
jgi:hypothetical protein